MNYKIDENIELIRVFSDIHLDFDVGAKKKNFTPINDLWYPIQLDTDKETVLILAGDIWHSKKAFSFMNFSWFKEISKRFKYVIFVNGNHDYWDGNITQEKNKINERIKNQDLKNVYFLQNDILEFNNVIFFGTTLWLNFINRNYQVIDYFNKVSKDKDYIRHKNNYEKFNAKALYQEHLKDKFFLEENLPNINEKTDKQIFVISHHPPTKKTSFNDNDLELIEKYSNFLIENKILDDIHNKEHKDFLSLCLDYNNLETFFYNKKIDFWVHGHSHNNKKVIINNTSVFVNARGYVGMANNLDNDGFINLEQKNLKLKI